MKLHEFRMHQMTALLAENESVTGSQVVGLNQQRLQAPGTLFESQRRMTDLDERVKQISKWSRRDQRYCRKHQLAGIERRNRSSASR